MEIAFCTVSGSVKPRKHVSPAGSLQNNSWLMQDLSPLHPFWLRPLKTGAVSQSCCRSPLPITWSCMRGHRAKPPEASSLPWSSRTPLDRSTTSTQPRPPGSRPKPWPPGWASTLSAWCRASWPKWKLPSLQMHLLPRGTTSTHLARQTPSPLPTT